MFECAYRSSFAQIEKKHKLSDKMLSTTFMFFRYKLAHHHGILSVILFGDYLAMFLGVLLFHWQHVFTEGYARDQSDWNLRDAANPKARPCW